jgi:Domain of unknown function (DU1801)
MSTLKTLPNDASAEDFLNAVEDETQRKDSFKLLELFKRVTGKEPVMWGTAIVGFGKYHYKSERSSQEGDWPLAGFSPRKQNLTLYVMPGFNKLEDLLEKLGNHKTSKACLYIKRLSEVDMSVLEQIVARSYEEAKRQYLK